MAIKRTVALAVVAALTAMPGIGFSADCEVHVDDAGPADAHIADPVGDAQGVVLGDGSGGELGDVYQAPDEADDLLAAYMSRNGDGDLEVHFVVKDLLGVEANLIYYFLWDHVGADAFRRQRFVQALLKPYRGLAGASEFGFGYFGPKPVGNPGFNKIGNTTGHITTGSPGEVVIGLPHGAVVPDPFSPTGETVNTDDWGAPAPGSLLSLDPVVGGNPFGAETRILAGTPEPLPNPPSPFTHGFVFQVDDSSNAGKFCDVRV